MNYSNASVRRQDRLMEEDRARQILKEGEYGVLSLQAETGGGYGIPINYAWDGNHSVYLHCAREGRKLRCIERDNRVSFCVIGKTKVISEKFTTEYESIVLTCTAHMNLTPEEKLKAMEFLLEKYSPDDLAKGIKYAEQLFERTEIIRLDIFEWSGKRRS